MGGLTIEELSKEFNCTSSTIIRNIKKDIGEKNYKELVNKFKKAEQIHNTNDTSSIKSFDSKENVDLTEKDENLNQNLLSEFIEILPVDFEIDNTARKELSSVPIAEVEFPKIVYMIVDKNIELEIKLLKDYPDWEFLPNEDLNRKTIEIFFDLKKAKRVCKKEKKVIKVPNTDVFRIVSPILISRGISRIVSEEILIAL